MINWYDNYIKCVVHQFFYVSYGYGDGTDYGDGRGSGYGETGYGQEFDGSGVGDGESVFYSLNQIVYIRK